MKSNNFSVMPSVSISRSKFVRSSQHKTTMNLGEITPIYVDEVLPGDTRKLDFGSLIRMSTPIAPVMDNIYIDYYAFYVPNRLVWDHWKEFMGENSTTAGIYAGTEYMVPSIPATSIGVGSLGDHLGLPIGLTGTYVPRISALPIRAYRLIYNRWFRDQNVIAPLTVSKGDLTVGSDLPSQTLQKAAKVSDYFTRSLPYAQKGSPVTIPLGTTAPLIADSVQSPLGVNPLKFGYLGTSEFVVKDTSSAGTSEMRMTSAPTSVEQRIQSTNLKVDLSQATAATINQLRFAFQYQKLLEKDALYGTRYWEILHAHFGIIASDASLQEPEYLGHHRTYINVDQVVQTTGIDQATPSDNELGETAAVSVTGDRCNILTKSFTEHGHILVLAVARHDQTYTHNIERMWSRKVRTDFYFPVFANLGAQPVYNKEIFADGTQNNDNIFGYQEAWSEYRYKPSKCTGLLNPSVTGSLGWWTLANNFAACPTLGQTFIEQDRNNLARVLNTGSTGPDFICDFAFKDIAVRPMPVYSVPGLIDHH